MENWNNGLSIQKPNYAELARDSLIAGQRRPMDITISLDLFVWDSQSCLEPTVWMK